MVHCSEVHSCSPPAAPPMPAQDSRGLTLLSLDYFLTARFEKQFYSKPSTSFYRNTSNVTGHTELNVKRTEVHSFTGMQTWEKKRVL